MTVLLALVILILFFYNLIFINSNKWVNVFFMLLFLIFFVPIEIQGIITGKLYSSYGSINLSLAGYDVIIISIITLITKKKVIKDRINIKHITKIIILIIGMILIRAMIDGIDFLSNKLFDNYILPISIGIIILCFIENKDLKKIYRIIYVMIFINAIIACFEFFYGKSILFHNYYYSNIGWYKNIYDSTLYGVPFRSTSFLSHPLTNGLYFNIALIYLLNQKKYDFNALLSMFILLFAIYTTNSRMCLLASIIFILYYIIKNKKYILLLTILLLFIIIIFSVDFSTIYYKIFVRDVSGSSIDVRINALHNFNKLPFLNMIFGSGYNNTARLLLPLGITANLEISYLIILLENGLLGFILYISILASLYKFNKQKNNKSSFKSMINQIILFYLIICLTSNSIADPGTLNYLLLIIIATHGSLSSIDIKGEKQG